MVIGNKNRSQACKTLAQEEFGSDSEEKSYIHRVNSFSSMAGERKSSLYASPSFMMALG
ncbi:hypothetical protein DPMN_013583 [Dreissena polymorpha]|uniref:Uncharacterized protein n=1 Tax=Dreissena polymorpha TaxID=45954 RepID=A0A9D4N817_DREPO|nr:hypothetical protein DPMN_013583 [Dreissena polymorpha]